MSRARLAALLSALLLTACGARERVILLPDEGGGAPGGLALITEAGETVPLADGAYTETRLESGAAGRSRAISARMLIAEFGPLLAALPDPPKSFLLYFETGSTRLAPSSEPNLERVFSEVATRTGAEVQVTGHTDRVGDVASNDDLSLARAKEIKGFLIERGLAASQVRAVGRGEREPLVPTDDGIAERRNRRVEVIVR